MSLNETRLVRHVAVHILPSIFLDDAVESVERRIVIGGIAGDHFALETRLQKIKSRARHLIRLHQIGIVGVDMRVDLDADIGSVRVRKAAVDFIETWRLVVEEFSILLPANKILQRLEHGEIGLEFSGLELSVDLRVEHIAEAAGDRNVHSMIARGKILRRSLPGCRRSARVENDAALGLCLLIECVQALRSGWHSAEDHRHKGRSYARDPAAEPCKHSFCHKYSFDKSRNSVSPRLPPRRAYHPRQTFVAGRRKTPHRGWKN